MDEKTTLQEMKDKVVAFSEERDWSRYHNPRDLAIHLTTEAAELLDHFRYKADEELPEVLEEKRDEIESEVADVLILLCEFASMHDVDLSDAFTRKMEENRRKYPVEKSKGNHKKYNEL